MDGLNTAKYGTGHKTQDMPRLTATDSQLAEEIARAVSQVELQVEGHLPRSVAVSVVDCTLVISLEGALSAIEHSLLETEAGVAQVQEFRQQLFLKPPRLLWQEIERIAGGTYAPAAHQDPAANACVKVFPNGTVVHVFLLAQPIGVSAWSGSWSLLQADRMNCLAECKG